MHRLNIMDVIQRIGLPFIKMENKDYLYLTLIVLLVSGLSYEVYDNEIEVTCRTNKPYGWNVLEEYNDGIVKAECPYITKEPIITYCKDFRRTTSYERYGCQEVSLVEKESTPISKINVTSVNIYVRGVN